MNIVMHAPAVPTCSLPPSLLRALAFLLAVATQLKGLLTPQEASRLQEELGTRLTHASRSFSKIGPLSRREHRKLLHNRTRSILEGDLQSLGPSGRSSVDDEDEADSGSGEDEKE